jgi:hypothetical protein
MLPAFILLLESTMPADTFTSPVTCRWITATEGDDWLSSFSHHHEKLNFFYKAVLMHFNTKIQILSANHINTKNMHFVIAIYNKTLNLLQYSQLNHTFRYCSLVPCLCPIHKCYPSVNQHT